MQGLDSNVQKAAAMPGPISDIKQDPVVIRELHTLEDSIDALGVMIDSLETDLAFVLQPAAPSESVDHRPPYGQSAISDALSSLTNRTQLFIERVGYIRARLEV